MRARLVTVSPLMPLAPQSLPPSTPPPRLTLSKIVAEGPAGRAILTPYNDDGWSLKVPRTDPPSSPAQFTHPFDPPIRSIKSTHRVDQLSRPAELTQ